MVITLDDGGLRDIERRVFTEYFGAERARQLQEELDHGELEPLDDELQEIIDDAPDLLDPDEYEEKSSQKK